MSIQTDFLVVGAGIIGLAIVREINKRYPDASIAIIEKEPRLGVHASGRNSGVLHTGIYYPANTHKARFCKAGADEMLAYALERNIPVRRDGKVIVASDESSATRLDSLLENAHSGGISAVKVDENEIREIEPFAMGKFGGIFCKDTAVIDSPQVLDFICNELTGLGVKIYFGQELRSVNVNQSQVRTNSMEFNYGFLINSAGSFADKVAKLFGIAEEYQLVPFKGIYYKLRSDANLKVRSSIYPVPNPQLPFLGVHFTKVINGDVYVGPTAIPALGRENYGILSGIRPLEAASILFQLSRLYIRDVQNFRNLVHSELPHYRLAGFIRSASKLVEGLRPDCLEKTAKVGIRPQLINIKSGSLEMDFIIEPGPDSLHVLNSISPAFTSSFAVAKFAVDQIHL